MGISLFDIFILGAFAWQFWRKSHAGSGFYDLDRELCHDNKGIKGKVTKSRRERSQKTGTKPIMARSDEDGDDILAYVLNGFPARP